MLGKRKHCCENFMVQLMKKIYINNLPHNETCCKKTLNYLTPYCPCIVFGKKNCCKKCVFFLPSPAEKSSCQASRNFFDLVPPRWRVCTCVCLIEVVDFFADFDDFILGNHTWRKLNFSQACMCLSPTKLDPYQKCSQIISYRIWLDG